MRHRKKCTQHVSREQKRFASGDNGWLCQFPSIGLAHGHGHGEEMVMAIALLPLENVLRSLSSPPCPEPCPLFWLFLPKGPWNNKAA